MKTLSKYLDELKRLNEITFQSQSLGKNETFFQGIKNLVSLLQLNWVKKEHSLKLSSVGALDSKNHLSTKKTYSGSQNNQNILFTVARL